MASAILQRDFASTNLHLLRTNGLTIAEQVTRWDCRAVGATGVLQVIDVETVPLDDVVLR